MGSKTWIDKLNCSFSSERANFLLKGSLWTFKQLMTFNDQFLVYSLRISSRTDRHSLRNVLHSRAESGGNTSWASCSSFIYSSNSLSNVRSSLAPFNLSLTRFPKTMSFSAICKAVVDTGWHPLEFDKLIWTKKLDGSVVVLRLWFFLKYLMKRERLHFHRVFLGFTRNSSHLQERQ